MYNVSCNLAETRIVLVLVLERICNYSLEIWPVLIKSVYIAIAISQSQYIAISQYRNIVYITIWQYRNRNRNISQYRNIAKSYISQKCIQYIPLPIKGSRLLLVPLERTGLSYKLQRIRKPMA